MKNTSNEVKSLLLDSKLITRVWNTYNSYDFKVVKCGNYIQLYYYPNRKIKRDSNYVPIDINNLHKKSRGDGTFHIEDRNILRTKLNCQRLAKCNAKEWSSFITLTYANNMQDIKQAKLDLNYFVKNIKKIKNDFKYISIIEFQKRGAIHFHLLTNLSKDDYMIVVPQKDNSKYFDVKFWAKGFTSYEDITGDIKKIIGYISKYMTKDVDDRLFNVRRYTSSSNLIKPIQKTFSLNCFDDNHEFNNLFRNLVPIYTNEYEDAFGNPVTFEEYFIG